MPSAALASWRTASAVQLNEVESAHAAIGGTGRGRRYATGQLNNAYAVLLSSQFQRFCRDLHSEAADHLGALVPPTLKPMFVQRLTEGRKLDNGNPNPGNIGGDYGRLGIELWPHPMWAVPDNARHRRHLEALNTWRNAIAHQDFAKPLCGGRTVVALAEVRQWRRSCQALAVAFDRLVGDLLQQTYGSAPW